MPYASDGDVRVYYEIAGNPDGGPLLLHPGGCGDRRCWAYAGYLGQLSEFRCILVDHRGRGLSDKPRKPEAHLMHNYVGDVIKILDDLGIERVAFWGYSDGGRIGFATASSYPRRVSGVISTGNWGQWMPPVYYEALVKSLRVRGMSGVIQDIERDEGFKIPGPLRTNLMETDPEMYALNEEVWNWERAPLVSDGFQVPVLLIVGEAEDPSHASEELANRLGDCELLKLRMLGHLGAFVNSELGLPAAKRFLERVSVPV